jgi:integrase
VGKINFTKRSIENLPIPKTKRATHYDQQVRGLGVLIQPSGHRSFFWFRKVRGIPTWRTIGAFPDFSIEQARAEANKLSGDVATWKQNGFDDDSPFERHSIPTFEALVKDYVEKHIKSHASRPERAAKNVEWMVDKYLASWRNRKITAIRKREVLDLHAQIGTDHGKHTANRIVQLLKAVFYWGAESGARGIKENPAMGVKLFHEGKRRRFLQPDELPRFFSALKKETNTDLRDFVQLAMWTGARRNDVLSMRWQDVALADNRWLVPDPKNRTPYVIALTPEAIAVLRHRHRSRHRKDQENQWVFPSRGKSGHIVEVKSAWKKLLVRTKVTNLRIHDLRRTLGSWQAIQGSSLTIVGASLGHKSLSATEVYGQLILDPVRDSVLGATKAMIAASKKKPKALPAPDALGAA